MPLEYAGSGVVKEHTAVREAVGHLRRQPPRQGAWCAARAPRRTSTRRLTNDLGRIAPGQGAVHAVLRRRDRRHRRRPDRLPARRRRGLPDPERREHRRGAAPAARPTAPDGVEVVDHHTTLRGARRAGPASRRGARRRSGCPPATTTCPSSRPSYDGAPVSSAAPATPASAATSWSCENDAAPAPLGRAASRPASRHGLLPCGLGARDTLRTEMGYPLHGQDISLDVTPVQARLGWAVGWKKDAFWGKEALVAEKEQGPARLLRGLVATGRGIPRPGMRVLLTADVPLGEVTSGHVLADPAQGRRPRAGRQPGRGGCRGLRRRPRPARGVHGDPAAVRAARRPRALAGSRVSRTPAPAGLR